MVRNLFLIGAGFNLDANTLVSSIEPYFPGVEPSLTHSNPEDWELAPIHLRYPTVRELVQVCFGKNIDNSESAEKLFVDAYRDHDWVAFNRLTTVLQGADHYIATPLSKGNTIYSRFFDMYSASTFISYNYDGFIEIFLKTKGRWDPRTGFGVQAEVQYNGTLMTPEPPVSNAEINEVIHLHGTLNLYPIEADYSTPDPAGISWITLRSKPRFIFDPDSLASSFSPFCGPPTNLGYITPEKSFIPPIPDKKNSLTQIYYGTLFDAAIARVRRSKKIIAIGYSFAPSDSISYDFILKELFSRKGTLIVVSPSAHIITSRLRQDYHCLNPSIVHHSMTFAQWVQAEFPAVQKNS